MYAEEAEFDFNNRYRITSNNIRTQKMCYNKTDGNYKRLNGITVCQKGVKNKRNCLGMTHIFFESIYPKASKKGRKKIFGVQKLNFLTF